VSGVLARLLRDLHAAGIITEDLSVPDDWNDLEAVYRGLCRLPNIKGAKRRRIDFLTVPWVSRGAALLYYTGDDIVSVP
jgi:DNA polymerase lambda